MDWMQERVREFRIAAGEPAPDEPNLRDVRLELHASMLLEETVETLVAMGYGVRFTSRGISLHKDQAPDWTEVVDGLCDIVYIALGIAVEAGLDLVPFFREVHESNMRKVRDGVNRNERGKITKPRGWKPPRINQLLLRALGERQ